MKFIVVSDKTIEKALVESSILGDMKSEKEIELEKKKKEEELKKKKEEELKKNNEKNDAVTTNNNKKDENKVDTNKVDTNKVDTNKVDTNKVDTNKVDTNKVDTNKPEYKIDKSTPTMSDFKSEVKPTNPSGKVIPKPTKPLMKNSPAAKAGIPIETRQKFANQNAAFQATKKKDSGYTKMDFIKDFPKSQTAKKYNKGEKISGFSYKKNLKNSYEPYHIVLGYLLSEGHADTVNEAHYVMTQMDDETVQEIVGLDEIALGTAAGVAGALTLGGMGLKAIKDMYDRKKKMDKGGKFTPGSTMDNIQKKNEMLKNM